MFDGLLLSGTSTVSLDAKGRFLIPARYRQALLDQNEGTCVVTRSLFDKCLWLYPSEEWDTVVKTLGSLPTLQDPLCRTIQRVVLGNAVFCQLDAQGRLLLTPELKAIAGLKKNAYLIGFNNKFELWSEDNYNAQCAQDEETLAKAVASLSEHTILNGLKL